AADETNTTGLASYSAWSNPFRTYTVGLRVTDNDSLTDYDYVNVDINDPPVASLKKVPDVQTITQFDILTLDGTDSTDSDGSIVLYEFDLDWDNNPSNFNADVSNTTGIIENHRFLNANPNLIIGLRVTDNEGYTPDSNIDSVQIEVTPYGSTVIWVDIKNVTGPWTGNYASPFQYIQDAVDVAADNNTIWILPGIYNEDNGGAPSSGDAEISISGISGLTLYGDMQPIVNLHAYSGGGTVHGLSADSCPNLTLDGLSFQAPPGGYASAIALNNCAGSMVQNCKIMPLLAGFTRFLQVDSSPGCIAQNNELNAVTLDFRGSQPSYFYLINSSDDVQITENIIAFFSFNVPATSSNSYSYLISFSNSLRPVISKNIIRNGMLMINDDSIFNFAAIRLSSTCNNAVIRNNLISNITVSNISSGQSRMSILDFHTTAAVDIYNNTIDTNFTTSTTSTVVAMDFDQMTGVNAYNNIVTNISSAGNTFGYRRNLGDPITVDYSDLWALTGTPVVRFSNVTEGGNCINADPLYMSPPDDYHLQGGSPCEGTGSGGQDMGCYGGTDPLP
ncbi:MAG: hypothetical protein ABIG42_05580, partial [bacterium]